MSEETIERVFPVQGKARLNLSNINGAVRIRSHEEPQIRVKAVKRQSNGSPDRTEIEMNQAEDGQVTIATRFKGGILGFLMPGSPGAVDYEVYLPNPCEVQISGVSSEIEAHGLEGDLSFSSVSGEARLQSLAGKITFSSVSGDLDGRSIQGDLRLKTVSGSIRLNDGKVSSLEASTVSGDLWLEGELPGAAYRLKTVSGAARLELPQGSALRAEMRSVSGALRTTFPDVKTIRTGGLQTLELGSGGAQITFTSVSGDMIIHWQGEERSDEAATSATTHPDEASRGAGSLTAEERMAILNRIANGELSVEEGLQALNPH